jgi:beta-lactamase class A
MRLFPAFLAACLVVGPPALGARPAAGSTADLIVQLDGLVRSFPGTPGLYVADPGLPQALYTHGADERFITASLYKLGILAEVESRVDAGTMSYRDQIEIQPEDITDDGSYELAGTVMTVDEALEAMITISDNGTALAFWHQLGPPNINATLQKLGLGAFHIALDDDDDNTATPRVIGQYFTLLAQRKLVSPAASERMLARLERQTINDRLPAELPPSTVVAHKTGNLVGVVHDAGIIYTSSGPRIVVGMTADADDEEADRFLAGLGALVYAAVLEPPANARYQVPRSTPSLEAGSSQSVTITVTNAGTAPWSVSGAGSVRLVWDIQDAQKRRVSSSASPLLLPPLAPSASAPVVVQFFAPTEIGDHTMTVGLADANGTPLAPVGAATATFDFRVHVPYLVAARMQVPSILHRSEASLAIIQYSNLPSAGPDPHTYTLFWRAIDPTTGRSIASGSSPLGTSLGPGSGTFFTPFNAPPVRGTFRLQIELREAGKTVSETFTQTVTIAGARTFPGESSSVAAPGRQGPQRSGVPQPSGSPVAPPRGRTPAPTRP